MWPCQATEGPDVALPDHRGGPGAWVHGPREPQAGRYRGLHLVATLGPWGPIGPPLWPGKATSGPLCGLARPHQAPLWPGKATSGQIRPPAGQIRPPAGRRKAGFCPDPARAGVRKGRVGLSGPGWPRMLPARPLGPSGALLGPSRGPWGPKWAPGPPWGPPLGPSPIPPSGWPSYWPPSDGLRPMASCSFRSTHQGPGAWGPQCTS